MLKKIFFIMLAGAMCLCLSPANVRADALHYPTETTFYDPALSYGGVHLLPPMSGLGTYLIDLDGRLLHKWMRPSNTETIVYATMEENGLLSRHVTPVKPDSVSAAAAALESGGAQAGLLEEVNWYGNVVRSWHTWTNQYRSHHRYDRIFNKRLNAYTYLFICWEPHTQAEAIAMGATGNVPSAGWSPDSIYEFDYSGNVVWKWSIFDHLTQSADPAKPNYVADVFTAKNRMDINMVAGTGRKAPQGDWNHVNSLGYDPTTGYVVFNSREYDESYVIDHDGTFVSATDFAANIAAAVANPGFVYRFGAPKNYHTPDVTISGVVTSNTPFYGSNGTVQIFGAHSVHFIRPTAWKNGPALPGAGNILWFDNHGSNNNPLGSYSQLLEVNPRVTGPAVNGVYPAQSPATNFKWPDDNVGYVKASNIGSGYSTANQSNQVVWRFRPQNDWGFSSAHISGAQRLPNGNTIGTAGEAGHVIEVTAGTSTATTPEANAGTTPVLAWEYQNPMYVKTVNGNKSMAARKFNSTAATSEATQMFCSFRYSPNYPGLKNYLVQYSDGTIQPILKQPGVGFTLTGQVPCRSIPCQYVGAP